MGLVDLRSIGGRIALARSEKRHADWVKPKGVTQVQLGEAIGVHRVTVSDWERNPKAEIQSGHLLAIANFLGVEANWLLTGQGPMRPSPTSGKTFGEVIYERMAAIKGAIGYLVAPGHESGAFEDLAMNAQTVATFSGILFYLEQDASNTNRASHGDFVKAILEAKQLERVDRGLSAFLINKFKELADLFDKTAHLFQDWENGDLELTLEEDENPDLVFMDEILKLTAAEEYQVIERFIPRAEEEEANSLRRM
jgi:transcriptional regulator with XRE-family HTH domain